MEPLKAFATFLAERFDVLRHFKGDHAGWKFAAHCVNKLPAVLISVAIACHYLWPSGFTAQRTVASSVSVSPASK